jgi:hypothetical protein
VLATARNAIGSVRPGVLLSSSANADLYDTPIYIRARRLRRDAHRDANLYSRLSSGLHRGCLITIVVSSLRRSPSCLPSRESKVLMDTHETRDARIQLNLSRILFTLVLSLVGEKIPPPQRRSSGRNLQRNFLTGNLLCLTSQECPRHYAFS